jgi:hypothetical protein
VRPALVAGHYDPGSSGYHLNRMFPKLGIISRSQLHAAVSLTPVG